VETERKEKVETDLRSIVEHRKEANQVGAIVEINDRQKTSAVFGREPRRRIEDGLVYRDAFWPNLKSLAGNTSLLQRLFLLFDIRLIVDTFQSLPELSENRFQLPELGVKIGFLEAPFFAAHVTLSRIIKVQILPGDAMLVQVDLVHSPHEHEAGAALLTELVYERFPIGLHFPINRATAGAPAAQCFACPLAEPFRLAPA